MVAPPLFGAVEGSIGVFEEGFAIPSILRINGNADTGLDVELVSGNCKGSFEDIENALILFAEAHPDMVMSCCEARKNPYFNLVEPDATGALHVSKPLPGGVVARQQAPVVYEHAASTYVVSPDYLRRAGGLWDGRVIPYLMPPERCVDIDSPFDFTLVEFLLRQRLEEQAHD